MVSQNILLHQKVCS